MEEQEKNPHAVALGKKGGAKLAERGPEYFAQLQAKRKKRTGGRPKNPPKATHDGTLKIGDLSIPCAVLNDGTRVLTQAGFMRALGRSPRPRGGGYEAFDQVPAILRGKALSSLITEDLLASTSPVKFQQRSGSPAWGYKAEILPKVCDVFLQAREKGLLPHNQQHIAKRSEILVRGLAQTGIIALVDEATGYQAVRDREALQAILDKYLRKELAAWAKRFPDEFYEQIFRLKGWQWKGMADNRPWVVGKFTKDLVYERLAPGIVKELEERNPKDSGRRRAKHHQWLTVDVGHPALAQHLHALIGLMRASDTWDQFHAMVQRAFPKKGDQLLLPGRPEAMA